MILDAVIKAILGPLIGIKKSPYCLWLWNPQTVIWENRNAAGSSARRCKKARKAIIKIGYPAHYLIILPKGTNPPALVNGG
jgi:hypothetical protein